jgi:hypothetical protein
MSKRKQPSSSSSSSSSNQQQQQSPPKKQRTTRNKTKSAPSTKKRIKRSDLSVDNIPFPTKAMNNIKKRTNEVKTDKNTNNQLLHQSYDCFDNTQFIAAKALLRTYGFVKFKIPNEKHGFLDAFYNYVKSFLERAYQMDIDYLPSVSSAKKTRTARWPPSLNTGRVGPSVFSNVAASHSDKGDEEKDDEEEMEEVGEEGRDEEEEYSTLDINHLFTCNAPNKGERYLKDMINQSLEAYQIRKECGYPIFSKLMEETKLHCTVEPTVLVFPSDLPADVLKNIKRGENTSSTTEDEPTKKRGAGKKFSSKGLTPAARLVYSAGVLVKRPTKCGDNNNNKEKEDEQESQHDDDDGELGEKENEPREQQNILKYGGLIAVTEGTSFGVVPGAHADFPNLLQYMQEIRHTEKRTVYSAIPAPALCMESYIVEVPLEKGEILIYSKLLPTKICALVNKKTPTPFMGLEVSFFPAATLTMLERSLRSTAFLTKNMGSDLKIFGHVENVKRRGIPTVIKNASLLNEGVTGVSVTDPIIRKLIGLSTW